MLCRAAVETIRSGEGEIALENVTFVRLQESDKSSLSQSSTPFADMAEQIGDGSVGW